LFDKYYSFLNDEQRDGVYTTEGSVLILAGAGSGKTTVLVNRIVFIVKYGNAYYSRYVPHDIDAQRIAQLK
jgi:DNA helicase-2/ATP-dependent DNA helicase PcrA